MVRFLKHARRPIAIALCLLAVLPALASAGDVRGSRAYCELYGPTLSPSRGDRIANDIANIPTPIVRGNLVFVTTSYNSGSALLRIQRGGTGWRAEEVYFLPPSKFENHHGGVVLVNGYLYAPWMVRALPFLDQHEPDQTTPVPEGLSYCSPVSVPPLLPAATTADKKGQLELILA